MTERSTNRSTDRTAMLRRGTRELLEQRGMAADPAPLAPPPQAGGARAARTGPHHGDEPFGHGDEPSGHGGEPFGHGGHRTPAGVGPAGGSAPHPDLPGHRHRGAERHSAH
ncbi:hypothetical protein K353_02688 [Kitasatospora sp. SolWspMP-SS2h]|uniref:hypothetical protein n=1 Tax=Kitasatospora sp. SolWspMP-SS2h TaxID=1305729 RepID=UPI000DBA5981|nr:hypothetical protein [Kitasatospora sp. SolWspMP-SS2h]RAJ42335.1 hypothetical protein K353_02688 [Kitasatospora sp. SolWspMP-SS2h]